MRLVRRKIHRAIPELDGFDDAQAARFVRTVNASWRRRVGRWAAVGVTLLTLLPAAVVGAVLLADWLDARAMFGATIGYVGWGVLLVLACGVGLVGALVVRDRLLRRSVRRVIARCGLCVACRYSLLGLPVGDDLRLTCPECGRAATVDPAMGELEVDATGGPVYRHLMARDDADVVARRRRRHRRFLKWSAVSVASGLALLAAASGAWWWHLNRQAERARADRNTRSVVEGLRGAMWEHGPEPDSAEQYCRVTDVLLELRTLERRLSELSEHRNARAQSFGMSADFVDPLFDAKSFDKNNGEGSHAAAQRYVLAVLREGRESGLLDRMGATLSQGAPLAELQTDWEQPFFTLLLPDLGLSRSMARANAARMVVALHAGDQREYVAALEQSLYLAQVVERDGLLIDQLVGYAIRSLVYNKVQEHCSHYRDAAWTRAVLDAVVRRADSPGLWRSLEVEEAGAIDAVQWMYARPGRVLRAHLGMSSEFNQWFMPGPGPTWLGSYDGNVRAIRTHFAVFIASARQPPWKRTPAPTAATGYPIVDVILPAAGKSLSAEDRMRSDRGWCVATLGAQVCRQTTGSPPASVHQGYPYVARPELLIDPSCGTPYGFGFVQEAGSDAPVFEVMHGDDDRPVRPPPAPPKPARAPGRTIGASGKK